MLNPIGKPARFVHELFFDSREYCGREVGVLQNNNVATYYGRTFKMPQFDWASRSQVQFEFPGCTGIGTLDSGKDGQGGACRSGKYSDETGAGQ